MSKNYCTICDLEKEKGIYLFHLFICQQCEEKIIRTAPEDPSYGYFVNKLKRINQQKLHS